VLLIAGGKSKGGNLASFVSRIAPRVKFAFLLGETRGALAAACATYGVACTLCSTLAEAVERAAAAAAPGDHVLLSPGFASFDMFRGYEDRGAQFERHVNNLGTTVVFR
jgi:UDP-N-acetylmuramoylalanine--D-glutamate ligase